LEAEEMGRDLVESSDLEGQNILVEEVHKAFPGSLDPEERGLEVDHSRDHIEDKKVEIVVVADVEDVVENSGVGMEAVGCAEVLVVMAG
jgi:hypothetical protein